MFESEDEEQQFKNDEVTYFSFIPFFEDELTYTMSAGRKQAFIRCAKWLFMCAGITDEEYREQVKIDMPGDDK